MRSDKKIEQFLKSLKQRFEKEMPKVHREIQLYEKHLAAGRLTRTPSQSPLFNE